MTAEREPWDTGLMTPREKERAKQRWLCRDVVLSDDTPATRKAKEARASQKARAKGCSQPREPRLAIVENERIRRARAEAILSKRRAITAASARASKLGRQVSVVYVIRLNGLNSYIKVGITGNLEGRLATFRTGSPLGVTLLAAVETATAAATEAAIHDELRALGLSASEHGGREWFRDTPRAWSVLAAHGVQRRQQPA